MSLPSYKFERIDKELIFYFISKNSDGLNPIFKVITYALVDKYGASYYNLGFGDYDERTNSISDESVSNNGDMRLILATVVSTLKIFFNEHPDKIVHIDGSDQTRRAYYHKLINDYAALITELYYVEGCIKGKVEPIQRGIQI